MYIIDRKSRLLGEAVDVVSKLQSFTSTPELEPLIELCWQSSTACIFSPNKKLNFRQPKYELDILQT